MEGGVAQLAEHMVCNHGVRGSSPLTSTMHLSDASQHGSEVLKEFQVVRLEIGSWSRT